MGGEKMIIKKSASSAMGLILTILFIMGMFFAGFTYISSNYTSSNIPLNENYTAMNTNLQVSQQSLQNNSNTIKNAVGNISQAPSNLPFVAYYGLVGIAAAVRSLFDLLPTSLSIWEALVPGLDFLPPWVTLLTFMGIVFAVVLIILKIFMGRTEI